MLDGPGRRCPWSRHLVSEALRAGADYIASLKRRKLSDAVAEPVDHPIIEPSINAVADTYAHQPSLAEREEPAAPEPKAGLFSRASAGHAGLRSVEAK